jgi:hypothetical protein
MVRAARHGRYQRHASAGRFVSDAERMSARSSAATAWLAKAQGWNCTPPEAVTTHVVPFRIFVATVGTVAATA